MAKGVFVVGTDTDVGKTIVTAGIMHVLRNNGYNATYFKASLSGALEINGEFIPGDTKIVSEASGLKEAYQHITLMYIKQLYYLILHHKLKVKRFILK